MATLTGSSVSGTLSATTFSGNGAGVTSLSSPNLNGSTLGNAQLSTNAITNTKLNFAGAVLQTQVIRYDARPGYSGPTNGTNGGTRIQELRLNITPLYSNSLIVCEWWIHGEANNHDSGWFVTTNGGNLSSGLGGSYPQWNTNVGQNSHSYLLGDTFYDQDTGSTPTCSLLTFYDVPGNTSPRFYEPVYGSNDGGTRTFWINSTVGSRGQNNHENGCSFGRITEIRQ
jgi:hypothetical protein